jgi:hypothetical protein
VETPVTAAAAPSAQAAADEALARKYVEALCGRQLDLAVSLQSDFMSSKLTADALKGLRDDLYMRAGSYLSIGSVNSAASGPAEIKLVAAHFERAKVGMRVTVQNGKVVGLFIRPLVTPDAAGALIVASLGVGQPVVSISGAVKDKLTPAMLTEAWGKAEAQLGKFKKLDGIKVQEQGGQTTVYVAAEMEKGELGVQLSLDYTGLLQGFFFCDPKLARGWSAPSYVSADAFTESEVEVGTSPALPGTLTVPRGAGPFPLVILVHGSGPNDRDESLGGIRLFKDLAGGLASQGVAVLRYDKRTKVSPAGVTTVKEETLDGVSDALALVASHPELDPRRVFVVGHSLGAYLAPWIGRDHPEVAGLVLMAAPTRDLLTVERGQYDYMLELSKQAPEAKAKLAPMYKELDEAAAPGLKPDAVVHGAPGAYWLALRGYDPVKVAEALKAPMLVLQGSRDYQVLASKDLPAWTALAARKPTVKVVELEGLNHMFVRGTGTPSPEEYQAAGHAAPEVLAALVAFVRAPGR